jgi:methyl-accepting chemotaxis protein
MKTSKWTIGARLIVAFVALTLVIAATSVSGIAQLSVLDRAAGDLRDNRVPSLKLIARLQNAVSEHRINISGAIIATDKAEVKDRLADAAKAAGQVGGLLTAYEPLVTEGEERGHFEGVKVAWADYLARNEPLLADLRAGDQDGARGLFAAANRTLLIRELDDLIEFNSAAAAGSGEQTRRAAENGMTVLIAALGIGLVLAIAATLLMMRSVSTPIRRMT